MRNAAAFLLLPVLITSSRAEAVPPTIHARWDNGGPFQPILDQHYEIVSTDPNSPNVILREGRSDWRIWSTDLDEADGVGNIGSISSPEDANFTMKLATADALMLFRGPYVDPNNEQDWTNYAAAFQGLKNAGFTHMGLQINVPIAHAGTITTRIAQMRQEVGLPLALFASPGFLYLTDKNNLPGPPHATNGRDAKYFDTVGFDPYIYKETDPSKCVPPTVPPYCRHAAPHDVSHDPLYTGTLWTQELDYLRDQLLAASLDPGDIIVLDLEVYARPDSVQYYYPNVIAYSTGRYPGDPVEDLEEKFDQYRAAWNARVQDLVNICSQYASGRQVYLYDKDFGEVGWVRQDAAANSPLAPGMYYGPELSAFECHLNQADYTGALPFIDFSFSRCPPSYCCGTVDGCPDCTSQNPFEAPPEAEGGPAAGSCPTWDLSITQQIGVLLRNAGVGGVVVYTSPIQACVSLNDYLSHAAALAGTITPTTGARDVNGITLVPSAPCTGSGTPFPCCTGNGTGSCGYTNIARAEISGDLDLGGLEVQESSEGGGFANVTIGGNLNGIVKIPTVSHFEVKGGVSQGSTITIENFTGGGDAAFNTEGGSFAGNLYLEAGVPWGVTVSIGGLLTETAFVNFQGAALGGTLSLHNGSDEGSTINIGPMTEVTGTSEGGELYLFGTCAGNITLSSVASAGEIFADLLTGNVTVPGLFDGSICADNFSETIPFLPPNIDLSNIGPHADACGSSLCPTATSFSPDSTGFNKTRFISFIPDTSDTSQRAIGVRLASLHHVEPPYTGGPVADFSACEGKVMWVGPPIQYSESTTGGGQFYAATLCKGDGHCCGGAQNGQACILPEDCPGGECGPFKTNWSAYGLIHVTGSAIVPSSQYDIGRFVGENAACATPLSVTTTRWGDVTGLYNPPDPSVQPDISDVSALVDKYRNYAGAPIKARAMLAGAPGNPFGEIDYGVLNVDFTFSHISACVDAFRGKPYPYTIQSCP